MFKGVPTRIADGDTLTLPGGTRIRFFGIDAPETDQTCTDAQGASYACGAWAALVCLQMCRDACAWQFTCRKALAINCSLHTAAPWSV